MKRTVSIKSNYEITRGDEPNTLYISQHWTYPVSFGPYFKGTEQEKEMKIQEKYRQEKVDAAEQHATSVDTIDNSVYISKSFDPGYAPNDIQCH